MPDQDQEQDQESPPAAPTTIAGRSKELFGTWQAVMLHPKKFFAELSLDGEVDTPLIFLAVLLVVSSLGHLLSHGILGYVAALVGNAATQFIFIAALAYLSKFFGGAGDFKNMLRAGCYASAPLIVHLLGLLGVLGNLYGLYLLFLGVQRTQKLNAKSSALTVAASCVCALAVAALWHLIFHGKHH